MSIAWRPALNNAFLSRAHDITVGWTRDFASTDTQVRTTVIAKREEWAEFAKDCYLPWYKQGGNWDVLWSQNYTLSERARERFPPPRSTREMTAMTAYHTLLGKRLVVDGVKRSLTVERAYQHNKAITPITIIECFGTQVHAIFMPDYLNLVANYRNSR